MCPETPQWWQNWGLTKDLELARSVLDFIPLLPFSDCGTKTVLDPEAVEEEGLEETAYPKLIRHMWEASLPDVELSKTVRHSQSRQYLLIGG